VRDYWHHWKDVVVGATNGLGAAAVAFAQTKPVMHLGGSFGGDGASGGYVRLGGKKVMQSDRERGRDREERGRVGGGVSPGGSGGMGATLRKAASAGT